MSLLQTHPRRSLAVGGFCYLQCAIFPESGENHACFVRGFPLVPQVKVAQDGAAAVVGWLEEQSTQKWFQEDWQQQNAVVFVVMDSLTQGNEAILDHSWRFWYV